MDLSGKTLRGYEILERIGDGGFGNVYRAAQPSVNREVAVKVILPEFANQPHFIRRFEAEAQLVARLEHPHIVPLFDYWRDPNGAYLVMRWLPGSLSKRLVDGPLSTTTTLHIVEQIASALVTAHRAGVIHRDIKPDNILLDEVGNAYLVDFGIAKVADHAGDTGEEAFGSPAYMPPEQIMGRKVTAQTDIYALGIVLFEMLAGEHPYKNIPLTELVFRQMESPLPFLGIETIPRDVDMVIQKATSKDPALRHQDALELATDLRRALRGTTTGADTQDVLLLDLPNERNPYKGLRAFDEADAGDFFGRDETVERLLRRLIEQDTNFLAVVGPSGSGKSSVVKAGVLPRIRQNALPGSSNWYIVDMVPGARPMRNLEAALLSVSPTPIDGLLDLLRSDDHGLLRAADSLLASAENQTNLLLVIDQLEEVFTLVELEDVRAQFLDLLYIAATEYASRVWIIVTMRADFIGRPLRYPAFGDLMRRRVEFVLPLSNEGLEMAVIGPARRAALTIEPTLLATVVADLHAEPGALPLLQYALTEIYERRTERTLTLEAYHDIGGITGALARRAEEVYADLEPRQQFITQQVFLRMVTLGEGTEDTRRRVWRSELLSVVEDTINLQFVLDKFGAARLLSFDNDLDTREPTVEVAHEALLREWRRLRDWLAASRNDIRLQRLLAAATNEWEDGKRDRSFLLAGARLSQFQEWAAATTVGLSESESAFLQASVAERAKQETIERRRQARELRLAQEAAEAEKRRTRQLRTFVQALAVGGLVLLVVAGLAAILGITARQNAAEANLRAGIAQALTLAAQAELEASGSSPDRAVLLALEALEQYPYTWQAERALARAVQGNQLRMIYGEHESPVNSAALDPTGLFAVSGDDVGIVRAWSTELEQSVAMFEAHDGAVNEVAFSPANDLIASAGNDGVVRVWSLQENAQVFEGANFGLVNGIAFSQTGELLASVSTEGAIRVWAVPSGNLQLSISEPILRNVQDAAFSPDDSHLLTTQSDAVRIWDLATQQEIFTLENELISSAQFSPDGGYILTANGDNTARLWDVQTGAEVRLFSGHTNRVTSADYSRDSMLIVTSSADGTARLWNADTGAPLRVLEGHAATVNTAHFSSDGAQIITASDDGTARVWSVITTLEQWRGEHERLVNDVAYHPTGERMVSASWDRSAIIWDAETGAVLHRLEGHTSTVHGASFVGERVATSSNDGTVIIWDARDGSRIRTLSGHESSVVNVAFSADGARLVSTSADGSAMVWNATNGEALLRYNEHASQVNEAVFSADGERIVSAGSDGTARVWDATTGETLTVFDGHVGGVTAVVFNPDATYAVSSGFEDVAHVWDTTTGEEVLRLTGHNNSIIGVAYTPNGRRIVTASEDGTARLWTSEAVEAGSRGRELLVFAGHTDGLTGVAVDAGGGMIATTSGDGTLRTWRIWQATADLQADARLCCVFRDLNAAERAVFGLGEFEQTR